MSDIDSDEPDFEGWNKRVFKKKMFKVLDFAHTHDESTLQTYGKYRSLKSKKFKHQHRYFIQYLMSHFEGLKFYEEHIFWSKRLLELICLKKDNLLYHETTSDMIHR